MTEQSKAEQELVEKIANLTFRVPWDCLNKESYATNHHLLADKIFALIKEALPELAKEYGYVKLEEALKPYVIDRMGFPLGYLVLGNELEKEKQ